MYMVRKRFMYWHIPATSKIHLSRDRNASYCFVPARLVKAARKLDNYIVERLRNRLATPLSKRSISVHRLTK